MINGMYLSCMGGMVEQARHQTIANNLANTETAGFKPDFTNIMQIPAESVWKGMGRRESDRVLEKSGGGAWLDATSSDFSVGPAKVTNGPLDLMLKDNPGEVSFFKVRAGTGQDAPIRYTRNGSFLISPDRTLVTDAGMPVLNTGGEAIVVPKGEEIKVAPNGTVTVRVNGVLQPIGQLGFATIPLQSAQKGLTKHGDSLFSPKDETTMTNGTPEVMSGVLEQSATNPIHEMVGMIDAMRAYQLNLKFLSMQDTTLGSAIQRLSAK